MRTLLITAALLASPAAIACGQSTHVWVGIEAVDHLPEGELKALLSREDLFAERVNGAMFPDGGYSPLTQDGYGETAHWEPFQTAYLNWIRDTYDPPYTGEAAPHVAFLMGLAAHGMADQIYDGVYLARALLYDGPLDDVDRASDISLTARTGPMPVVDDVVPYDTLAQVFDAYGQPTSPRTMATGQASLRIAVTFTSNAGQDEAQAAEADEAYPWTSSNLIAPEVFCSPACIQPAVAAYWQSIWERLHDRFDFTAQPVFQTWPEHGATGQPREAASIESQISVALTRALDLDSLTPSRVVVTDAQGNEHPTAFRMYYGNGSNVLNVWPLEDWAPDTAYTLTLGPGITSFDGQTLTAPWSMSFDTTEVDLGSEPERLCGCDQRSGLAAWWWLAIVAFRRRR